MSLPDEIASFPFPFTDHVYKYSNNSIPLEQQCSIEITSTYIEEIQLKRSLLDKHKERCYQSFPYTLEMQWEILDLIIDQLITYYPNHFHLEKKDNKWTFTNQLLDEQYTFQFGESSTLPYEPLDFIGRHVQEDLIFMAQRDNNLYLDAGQLCFPANWSIAFNVGMEFKRIHNPIPRFEENQLDDKILTFLLNLEAGNPWWRKNWSMMAGNHLDTSLETFDVWGKDRNSVTDDNVGDFVHLRVEVQKLFRLPGSHGILFSIHTHLLPLSELVLNKEWAEQFHAILTGLPPFIAEYKGIALYKNQVISYLQKQLL